MENKMQNPDVDIYKAIEAAVIEAVRNRWKLVASIVVLFVLIVGLLLFTKKPLYRATAVIKIPALASSGPVISPDEIERFIDSFIALRQTDEAISQLDNSLDINKETGFAISAIETKTIKGTNDHASDQIKITFELRDPLIAKVFMKRLLDILNNHKRFQKQIVATTTKLQDKKLNLQVLLRNIEKMEMAFQESIKRGSVNSWGFNPLEIDVHKIKYRQELIIIDQLIEETTLEEGKLFLLLDEPVIKQKGRSIKQNMVLAVIFGFMFGMILAVILEWNKRLKHTINS